ncbi:GNAT family N-acetyltransferase [Actinocorallia populi]|uniref:GNAT family N-acetyltransferase n=1 Tax=Actinocorallia populi TaxID=2079200 RepID=UPI000D09291E|nr:GNAT family N-acetyltransferase [Actinocorallia populi]
MIREFRPGDEAAVYDICLRTGASGEDATHLFTDPELLGHVYAGAYLKLCPDFASVVEEEGDVLGYILGAPDTRAFEKRCEEEWWPPLRERYPDPGEPATPDERAMYAIHHFHPAPDEIVAGYPSHLHIDLLPRTQGKGYGRRLMDRLREQLRRAGSPGLHLGVSPDNRRAVGFYGALGFAVLTENEHVIWMGERL